MKFVIAFATVAVVLAAVLVSAQSNQEKYTARVNKKFMDEWAAGANTYKTKSGILVRFLKKGDGEKSPNEGDQCSVSYHGELKDGTVFDSSYQRGQPADFAPNQVIPSWKEVLQLLAEGDKVQIASPPELAYGSRGAGGKIGPNAVLKFIIELHKVKGGKPAADARAAWKDATDVDFNDVQTVEDIIPK